MTTTSTASGHAIEVRLVPTPAPERVERGWPEPAAALLRAPRVAGRGGWAPYRVRGGPGTGKTSLLVDAVAASLQRGVDPESVLVLVSSRRAAVEMTERIADRVLGTASLRASRSPLVRTVHSYAFAVLRLQTALLDESPPRLVTSAEQDAMMRELLAGDVADGATRWPEALRPALGTNGFAVVLRDIMMRAAERGVGPERLIELGREHGRPEWTAAGDAYRVYEQATLLRGATAPEATPAAFDAAELVGAALTALATDEELLMREQSRLREVYVDDAHHLDPQAADLIRRAAGTAERVVIAGDGAQSIYRFRGASSRFLTELAPPTPDRDVVLTRSFRHSRAVASMAAAIAGRLPGARLAAPEPAPDAPGGTAVVRVYQSAAKEAAGIADLLRRAHLFDGVPWNRMAIVARSVTASIGPLRRALAAAGVPAAASASETPLARQRSVAGLLEVLRCVEGVPDADVAVRLLSGPIGRADPVSLRRLRRGVRRVELAAGGERESGAVLAAAIADGGASLCEQLSDAESAPLRRVLGAVDAGRRARASGGGVEETLWAVWQHTGLAQRWTGQALAGGSLGTYADRELDGVVALFDSAAAYADTLPGASLTAFVDYVEQLLIPSGAGRRASAPDTVTIVSAHAAAGREWDVVAVTGLQEGTWPSLRSRGGVLGTPDLLDLLDGVAADALSTLSRPAAALAEERRLLLVAASRARLGVQLSAVDDGVGDLVPSRFIAELAGFAAAPEDGGIAIESGPRRGLNLADLVATLRTEVVAARDTDRGRAAAALLARLATEGVPGAGPDDWYGVAPVSTVEPLWTAERGPVVLSPSTVATLSACSLRWFLERSGGVNGDAAPALQGTLLHTLAQAVAGNVAPEQVTAELRRVWSAIDTGAEWYSRAELARTESMLANLRAWLRYSRAELSELGVEVDVDAVVEEVGRADEEGAGGVEPAAPAVRLRGRVDRLEADGTGRAVIVDLKTAKTVITRQAAAEHPQLAAYQLAIALGGVKESGAAPGGGRLVYVSTPNRTTGAAERVQEPLTPEQVDEWIGVVRSAAAASVGPTFRAEINPTCSYCPVWSSCPAQSAGRAVTDG